MSEKLVLIDGHSILNRAFYGVPELTNSSGLHTNAVYGFLNILFKILEEEQPQYLAVAFDVKAPTFRHKMYDAYKGTRKPMPQELHEQVPLIKDVLTACGVPILEKPGYEADDILGTLARRGEAAGMEVTLVSGDRDLLQIATDHICIRIPKTRGGVTVTENYRKEDVIEAYGVTPTEFIDVKALMGDTSDNIPGVPSIGEKTATALISSYKSIENAYAHIDEVKPPRAQKALREHYDLAQMSKKLAAICTEAPVEMDFEAARLGNLYTKEAYEVMNRLELKSFLKRFDLSAMEQQAEEKKEITLTVIDGLSEAEGFFRSAGEQPLIAVQTVADGGQLLGLAMAVDEDTVSYLACAGFLTEAYLKEKLEELAEKTQIAALDVKEILKLLDVKESEHYFDAGVAAYLLNPLKNSYTYDDLARDFIGESVPARAELLGKSRVEDVREKEPENWQRYVMNLAHVPFTVRGKLEEQLKATGMWNLFTKIEMPLIFSLHRMEQAGIRVEKEALAEYGRELAVKVTAMEQEIYALAGREFNINSPKQLGEILFDELHLPGAKKTKTGYSTSADVLEKLKPVHPIVEKVLEYRTYAKLKSTYADGLAGYISEDGRIHGTFNQTITATGRISSTEPNLQNIPVRMELGRAIRRVFVPEEGCVFVDADYSQIELRILAHMSGDKQLIEAYREEQDIHRITASQVFHVPLDEVTPQLRRNAKAVNFGIVYGISAFGLSEDLSITRKEAGEYIQKYFETYPGVKTFLDRLVAEGKEQGYVTTVYGRRRPIPELKSNNFMQRSFGERVAMNSPIQGTAADVMKIAMIRVDRALRTEGLRSRIILQVHDELLLEVPGEEKDQVMELLEREMTHAADFAVPLEVDVNCGDNWYTAH
ncbi:DNA polymerase I [Hominifimenecus microfluidus]|uniref:DNA polymerase I n=1 Tax=Hominifimenecus microfluidus TaxID=2885348 RepID=A0AAE3EBP9_9FIRM|nr:DNA polymerase I [Hominifimenecus microfluidus]MCC2231046.1 DNA polymerase I [Hominifimenecus microfluidus]